MTFLKSIARQAGDAIFPLFCIACGAEGAWLCSGCAGEVLAPGVFSCIVCRSETVAGATCERCRKHTPVEQLIAIDRYGKGVFSSVVRLWKYKSLQSVEPLLAGIVRRFIASRRDLFPAVSLVVPVPLHPIRECKRGFNQAEVLGRLLGAELGVPVASALARSCYTASQVKIPDKEKREQNVRGVFRCRDAQAIRGKDILLVDDVATSGATITQCARTLAESGAGRIFAFSLLRG